MSDVPAPTRKRATKRPRKRPVKATEGSASSETPADNNNNNVPKPVELLPHQTTHYERLLSLFQTCPHSILLDTSETGAGKTYTAGKIAQELKLPHLVIICPASAVATWKPFLREYGFPTATTRLLTYGELRSAKSPFVYREKRINANRERGMRFTSYTTREYVQLVQEGLFLIIDEVHNAKNWSLQAQSILALTSQIRDHQIHNNRSRALLLSATPFDKPEHLFHLSRLLGIVRSEKLYFMNVQTRSLVTDGYQDMIELARRLHPQKTTDHMFAYCALSARNIRKAFSVACRGIIFPAISSSMSKPRIEQKIITQNGFFEVPESQIANMAQALHKLRQVAQERSLAMTDATHAGRLLALQSEAIKLLEYAKREIFLKLALEKLTTQPTAKVLIFVSYHTTLQWLADALADYKPILFSGTTSKDDREKALVKIQAPDTRYRLFLGITQVSGESISLHDLHGDFPRYLFISPSFNLTHVYQSIGRINRVGVKSDSAATVVFLKGSERDGFALTAELKTRLLLNDKAKFLRTVLHEEVRNKALLPDEFPVYVEGAAGPTSS